MKIIRTISAILLFAVLAAWLLNIWRLRDLLPFYVIVALGPVIVVGIAGPSTVSLGRRVSWVEGLLDKVALFGIIIGLLIFVVASGAIERGGVNLTPTAKIGLGIAVGALLVALIPGRWLSPSK